MKYQRAAYLYADGHAVICYQETVRRNGQSFELDWVEIHEKWTDAKLSFRGRLIFSTYQSAAFLKLAKIADRIDADEKSVKHGSDATKEKEIEVGNLTFNMAGSYLCFHDLSVLNAGYTYQPEVEEAFDPNITEWGHTKLGKIHRVKQPALEQVA